MFIAFDNNGFKKELNKITNRYEYTVYHDCLCYKLDEDRILKLICKNKINNACFDGSNILYKDLSFSLKDIDVDNFIDFKKFDYLMSLDESGTIEDEYYYSYYDEVDSLNFKDKRKFNKLRYAADQKIVDLYKLVYYGDDVVALLEFQDFDNVYSIVTTTYMINGFNELDFIDLALRKYPKLIYMDGRSYVHDNYQSYGWKLLNFKSSLSSKTDEWNEFYYRNCSSSSYYYTYYDENIIVDYIENKHKKKIDMKKIKVYHYKDGKDFSFGSELSKKFSNLEFISWMCSGNGNYRFIGYNYFNLEDVSSYSIKHSIFIVTFEDIILCACKYMNHDAYIGLSYFEVNSFYKTIELENFFIKLFNKYVPTDKPLYLPMDDRYERETKLSERMKSYITSTLVKTNDDIRRERGY